MKGRVARREGLGVNKVTMYWMLGWMVYCMTGMAGSIANAAHVAGLVMGLVLGYGGYRLGQLRGARRE